jgi:hypothetical protein
MSAVAVPYCGRPVGQDNVFDATVAVNVLDHLPDPMPALWATHRLVDARRTNPAG